MRRVRFQRKKSILLVDDDRLVLESLMEILELEGYSVDVAETGGQAKEKLSEQSFNIALLDMKLHDTEGTKLLEIIKETRPEMVNIVITGYPTLDNAVDSLNIGADGYLTKPIDPERVLGLINEKLKSQEDKSKLSLETVKEWISQQIDQENDATKRNITQEKGKELLDILESYNKLLDKTNQMLKQSNADLENYAYVVSHDLKAPLRTIRSFSVFLIDDYREKLDETARDYLTRIVKAAKNMDELISDLLVLSRVGRQYIPVERINLTSILDEILIDLKQLIESRNAKVIVKELPIILSQKVWIKQLFINLIDNGLKFNKSQRPTVEVLCSERPENYLFTIRDNGIGIEQQYFSRIFSLFERLHSKEEYEGTGAGLAICKKIIEKFDGKIWVESTKEKGSTFFFTIPKVNDSKEQRILK